MRLLVFAAVTSPAQEAEEGSEDVIEDRLSLYRHRAHAESFDRHPEAKYGQVLTAGEEI
jgi:hypothetical protein